MDVRSLPSAAGLGGNGKITALPEVTRGVPRGVRVAGKIGGRFGGPCNTRRRLTTFAPFNSIKTITGFYFAAAALRGRSSFCLLSVAW